jgi:hypothetical protein
MDDGEFKAYTDGQNGSAPSADMSSKEYLLYENGRREYDKQMENYRWKPSGNDSPTMPTIDYSNYRQSTNNERLSRLSYRAKGAIAAIVAIISTFIPWMLTGEVAFLGMDLGIPFGFGILILSSMALCIVIINPSKWANIALVMIGAGVLWMATMVLLQTMMGPYSFVYDSLFPIGIVGYFLIALAAPGIMVAGVRGLLNNNEKKLAVVLGIFVVLYCFWVIWYYGLGNY